MVKKIGQKWQRVINENTGKYGYVLVNNKDKPVQFNSDSGYFKVYDSPNTQSHYYSAYLAPKNKPSNNTINDNNPVQLKEVQITAKKPTEFVGIQRTPDDHQAALARDRAVDAKVNPQNDQLQNFFANLMTGGMYSAVDQGTKNLAKGNYLEGAMQTATPIMFGPAESTVANLTRLGVGAYDLANKNGVQKTYNLAKQGNWLGAAKSAAGDALNLGMTIGGGYNLGKYNIPSFVQQAARNGNNTARSYLISKELNQNVKNFDGTVGFHTGEMPMENLQYFQQLPNGRWAIKGQILPNKNLYVDTSKAAEPTGNTSLKFFEKTNSNSLNKHLQGEDAVKMFKEYGGEKIPENSVNGPQLRAYVKEAREVYGLQGNTDITDEEIAQALYKQSKELSKNSKVVNEQGEPQLLFRGDTKDYTTLKDRPSPNEMVDASGTMDNSLGTLFLGEYPGFRGDRFDAVGSSRYLNGWYFNPITQKFEFRFSSTGTHPESSQDMQRSYLMFNNNKGWRGNSQAFIKAKSTEEYPNHLNLFISRSPEMRDATKEISVLDDDFLLMNGTSSKSKANYLGSEHTISPKFEMKRNDGTSLGEITAGDSRTPEQREVIADHYTNLLKDAETKNQKVLKSSADSPLREEHTIYSYFVVPNFGKFDVKHILPYDLRIPRNWKDPNIFRATIPLGLGNYMFQQTDK